MPTQYTKNNINFQQNLIQRLPPVSMKVNWQCQCKLRLNQKNKKNGMRFMTYNSFLSRATGTFSCSRYFATVRRAIL